MSRTGSKGGLLLVDAGNTRLKWLYSGGGSNIETLDVTLQQAESYAAHESPQDGTLRILAQRLDHYQPQRLALVHVLGQVLTQSLSVLCAQKRCELIHVNAQQSVYGIKSAYANPAHLGADRLVALVAARFFAQHRAAIIVDCGTAVTIDALQADGQHLGGLILPGLNLLSESLIQRTQAQHMAESVFEQPVLFADNTAQGIGSGCLFSLVGAIEGICQRMQNEMSEMPVKIICGGDAARIHTWLDGNYRLEPAALMAGLRSIAEQV